MNKFQWLNWANELRSLALSGLFYCKDENLLKEYEKIRDLSYDIIEGYSSHSYEEIEEFFSKDAGYQTPKLDSRAAVFNENKILLVQENNGLWTLPGGWVEPDLSIKENIIKEVKEEAGLRVKPTRLIAIQDRKKHNRPIYIYDLCRFFVLCEYINGEFEENEETIKSGYFKLDNLPQLMTSKTNYKQIEMCFNAYNNLSSDVLFD
ncbi:NUDIX hydrolase N-terminal domain-containing protein [Miniphocaeibacter halophilus]|uniref:NUDIX hydrolase n=1 Tax=Miniphocaeibacter halophilus TaxID=2931922 RepID=A0AC61N140_9FIRM|nr:NUDIX hydrolase [Miniphocaeibacter halophilus]QQK08673.1 NUDIX hydrolase [Miniphocaeibacter halophilus]